MPPFFTRGVLLDAPGYRHVGCLTKGSPIDAAELEAICAWEGVDVEPWDVVLIRTGYMGLWPDADRMAPHKTAGPDISAAHWLLERGIVATGTDTETYEVQPAPDPGPAGNPQPVHTLLLIENGIYLMESLDLEALARRSRLRVPVRGPAPQDPRRDSVHGRPGRRHLGRSPCPPLPTPTQSGGPTPAVPQTMDALVVLEPSRFEIQHVPVPTPGPDEVLARVRAVSICGTRRPPRARRLPGLLAARFPFIPGHEWAGEIVALGPGAERYGWAVGDRVAGTSHDACGVCQKCVEGRYNLCENYGVPGLHRQYGHNVQGADATYVVHGVKAIFHLPDELSFAEGAVVDPASIALHVANRAACARATRWPSPAAARSGCCRVTRRAFGARPG